MNKVDSKQCRLCEQLSWIKHVSLSCCEHNKSVDCDVLIIAKAHYRGEYFHNDCMVTFGEYALDVVELPDNYWVLAYMLV